MGWVDFLWSIITRVEVRYDVQFSKRVFVVSCRFLCLFYSVWLNAVGENLSAVRRRRCMMERFTLCDAVALMMIGCTMHDCCFGSREMMIKVAVVQGYSKLK